MRGVAAPDEAGGATMEEHGVRTPELKCDGVLQSSAFLVLMPCSEGVLCVDTMCDGGVARPF